MDRDEWSLQTQETELSTSILIRGKKMKLLKHKRFQERTASKWQGLCTSKWLQNRDHIGIVGKTVTCLLINKMSGFFLANSLTCYRSALLGPSHCFYFPFAFSLACCQALLEGMGTPPKYMFNVFQRHARFHGCFFPLLPNLLLTTSVLSRSFPKL